MEFSKVGSVKVFSNKGTFIRREPLPDKFSLYEDFTKDYFKDLVLANKFDKAVLKDPSILKAIPGKPVWGTCPSCYKTVDDSYLDKCPMFMSRLKGRAYAFYYCPDCREYFKVV